MQKMISGSNAECNPPHNIDCGSDFTVDFLFGYAGYEYRKCTDAATFKKEIVASIDAGKPVIVRVKSGSPRSHVITGYDGDALMCPDYCNVMFVPGKGNVLADKPEEPPTYSELDVVYIVGNKITPRYTVKDGLHNIRRVMECNISEGVWDGYLKKMGG